VLPAGLTFHGITVRERELAQARSALKQERQRSADAGALRAELGREREARTQAEGLLAQASQPRANDVIVPFGVERGEPDGGGPTVRPSKSGWIVLEVPVEPPFQKPYRAVLRAGNGREVTQVPDLQPNERNNTLSFSLPPSLLPPGDYSVTIEPGGQRFNFRVLPPG
jgi:hypothetical protein